MDPPPDDGAARFWERLANGETLPFRAQGTSMRPLFPPGSLFWIRRAEPRQLRRGDLVLVRDGDTVTLHRLLRRGGGVLETKGDWLDGRDRLWPESALRGRAVAVERRGGIWRLDVPAPRVVAALLAAATVPAGRALGGARAVRRLWQRVRGQ